MKQGSHGSHDESTMKLVYNADCLQKIQNETATKRWAPGSTRSVVHLQITISKAKS